MAEAGVSFSQLDRIGVTVGPGSFTGLRVGLAFAKGLAMALERPCAGVTTLEATGRLSRATASAAAAIRCGAAARSTALQIFDGGRALILRRTCCRSARRRRGWPSSMAADRA